MHIGALHSSGALHTTPYALPSWCKRPGRAIEAVHVHAESSCTVLEPGLVLLRQALGTQEQRALATECWAAGSGLRNPNHSFFLPDDPMSLNGPKALRGRIFDACDRFPELGSRVAATCHEWVAAARAADDAMPAHTASHLLLLYYRAANGTLGFHRDEQANDGTGDEPVVSLSLGASADFAVRHCHSEPARVLTLRSGDVLLFGGPCRKLLHAVVATRPAEAADDILPAAAGRDARMSLTLRHAPEVCGHEHLYSTFRPQPDDPRRETTGDERLLGAEEAHRRLKRMAG